ncbi:hypothetical protein BDM02DRAFT_1414341 [Thelephora ganbajun]|uniref:Uncharacterized protein n=1 Tax=Thelephora ganbajun TaxID=370292 RepID=A0ACB6Z1U9_THEGA|nr:hypothetical protein BDM02DRAFT_1414341 [Thelephora ganbajun]
MSRVPIISCLPGWVGGRGGRVGLPLVVKGLGNVLHQPFLNSKRTPFNQTSLTRRRKTHFHCHGVRNLRPGYCQPQL